MFVVSQGCSTGCSTGVHLILYVFRERRYQRSYRYVTRKRLRMACVRRADNKVPFSSHAAPRNQLRISFPEEPHASPPHGTSMTGLSPHAWLSSCQILTYSPPDGSYRRSVISASTKSAALVCRPLSNGLGVVGQSTQSSQLVGSQKGRLETIPSGREKVGAW